MFLEISQNSQENTCARVSFFNKVADLRPATLLKKRLWHRCLPVNFAKFLRISFLQNNFGGLLLHTQQINITSKLSGACGACLFSVHNIISLHVMKLVKHTCLWRDKFIIFSDVVLESYYGSQIPATTEGVGLQIFYIKNSNLTHYAIIKVLWVR